MKVFQAALLWTLLALIGVTAGDTISKAELQKIVDARHATYLAGLKSGDVEQHISIFAPDATILLSGSKPLKGIAAIAINKRDLLARVTVLDGVIRTEELQVSGDLAYEIGKFSYTIRVAGEQARVVGGTFLTVWQRQPDGNWLCQVDAGLPE